MNLRAIYPVTGKKMTVSVVFLKKCLGHSGLCGFSGFQFPMNVDGEPVDWSNDIIIIIAITVIVVFLRVLSSAGFSETIQGQFHMDMWSL